MGFMDVPRLDDNLLATAVTGTNTAAALNATYARKWKPLTFYAAGVLVITPDGDIAASKADHTSGATFTPGNWNYVRMNDYFVNVKAFGAKADGTTNDTAAIHAARDYAATVGFVVYIPPSATAYRTDALIANKANQTWVLAPGATIQPVTGTSTSIFQMTASKVTLTGGGTLDGSTTTQPGCAGIYSFSSSVTDLTIDNITILSTGGYGIQSCSSRTKVRNCTITNSTGNGITLVPVTTDMVDCEITGNIVDRSGVSTSTTYSNIGTAGTTGGLKILRTRIHGNVTIMAATTGNAGEPVGIECVKSSHYTSIVGNRTTGGGMGISVMSSNSVAVTGNTIFAPSWYGIELADSNYCTVGGNTVDGNGVLGTGAASSTYGIVLNNSTAGNFNTITGNTVLGVAAGASNSSSAIAIAGNVGAGNVISDNTLTASIYGITSTTSGVIISNNKILGPGTGTGAGILFTQNCLGNANVSGNQIDTFSVGVQITHSGSAVVDNIAVTGNTFVNVTTPSANSLTSGATLGSNIRWSGNVGSGVTNTVLPTAQIPDLSATYMTPSAVAASYVATSTKGVANGVASLDATGKVPAAQIASATGIPPWQPFTVYTSGQQTITSNNDVVTSNTNHTSSAAYSTDVAKWNLSTTFATVAPTLVSGRYYTPDGDAGTTTLTVGKLYFTPIWIPKVTTLAKIGIEVQTGVATAVVRLGLYADNNGNPGSLLLDAGTIDASVSGAPTLTISQAVGPGLVWMAGVSQTAGATVQILGGTSRWIGKFSPSVGGNLGAYTQTGVTAALPGTATPAATDFALRQFIGA